MLPAPQVLKSAFLTGSCWVSTYLGCEAGLSCHETDLFAFINEVLSIVS